MSLSVQGGQASQIVSLPGSLNSSLPPGFEPPVLLPTPNGDVQTDALSWMYLLTSKQQSLDVSSGRDEINRVQEQRAEAYKQEMEAIKRAVEAASHHSFWDSIASVALTIGKVAAVVGSIAVAVGTGGAGVVGVVAVAGAVLSSAGFAQGELHVLEKLGVDEGAASWIGVGLSIGGAACTGGAALATSASGVSEGAATVGKISKATVGAATVAGGAAKIEATQYEGDQQDALADLTQAQADQARMQRLIFMMLDELQGASESDNTALKAMRGAMDTKGETLVLTTTARA